MLLMKLLVWEMAQTDKLLSANGGNHCEQSNDFENMLIPQSPNRIERSEQQKQ